MKFSSPPIGTTSVPPAKKKWDALERGGSDDDENLHLTCEWCLPEKNAEDHAAAGHIRRAATKHVVPNAFRKRPWR